MTTPEGHPESEPVDPREHFRQVNYIGRADLSVLGDDANIGHVTNGFFSPDGKEADFSATVPFSEETTTEAVGDAKPDVEVDELLFRYPLPMIAGRNKPFDDETAVPVFPEGTSEDEINAHIDTELLSNDSVARVRKAADEFSKRVEEGDTSSPTVTSRRSKGIIGDPLIKTRG